MDKKIKAIIAIAFLLFLPSAMAGIEVIPGCTCQGRTACNAPYLLKSEYKCGDCTKGWTDECRTLYRTDYFSNCTKSTFPVQSKPQTDYVYCLNGKFESINWKTSHECRGNTSYQLDKAQLPAGFKWGYEHAFPTYCDYGCNQATGKCNPKPAQPQYKWECRGNYKVKTDITCGNIVQKEYCQYGCTNGECKPSPPKPKAGYVNQKPPAKTCTPTNYLACKGGNVYRRYIYKDCSQAEFLSTTCGSCQTCSNGKCVGKTTGYAAKPATTPAQPQNYAGASRYRTGSTQPVVTSNYGSLYSPSSKWVCSGSWKVPVDILGNNIWSSAKYCENGCSNGSCNQAAGQCTYNSDCRDGYYCARLSGGNACRPRY